MNALGDAEHVERLRDLQRELARGREHERARSCAAAFRQRRVGAHETLEHRNRKRRGLAGAGLGAADHVAPVEDRLDRLGLNRGGSGVPGVSDRVA